jgi:hypothetical protein
MFSSHWHAEAVFALKLGTLIAGLVAAALAWRAAALWLTASKVQIEDTTPRTMVSYDDNPALGILEVQVGGYATQTAYNTSSALNAHAARWTAAAAVLTGVAAVMGVI